MKDQCFNPLSAPGVVTADTADHTSAHSAVETDTAASRRMGADAGDGFATAILTRRLRKCIAEGAHAGIQPGAVADENCPRCGL